MATAAVIAPEAGENDNAEPQSQPRDFEGEARAQGWRPQEEFKGDPKQWVDAEAFIRRADEVLPLVRKENKHLKEKIAFLERDFGRQRAALMKAEQRAYDNALADIEAKQEKAVETGNLAEHRRLKEEAEKLRQTRSEDAADKQKEAIRAFSDWRDENEWYDLGGLPSATELERKQRVYFDRMVEANQDKAADMEPAAFIAHIGELVEARYLAAKTPRQKPAEAVAGVTRTSSARSARTGANLPPDAKAAAERYVRQGIPGYAGKSKAEAYDLFAKDYDWSAE